ncbi:hypothetical protein PF004_g3919 [Phytophthora fragariae]|uniref:RxLR effector protein n=1 Tax=Phytophthora fragariae TaxID=53985 RepID=A0A6G0PK43_9STRA|nr:hypothetical protein PF004_g3919 [Phytophthora fragariae]
MALPLTLIVLLRGYAVFGAQRSVRRYTPQNCNNTLDKIMQPCRYMAAMNGEPQLAPRNRGRGSRSTQQIVPTDPTRCI